MEQTKYLLNESELPQRWYNIRADMPSPPQPVLHPGTGQPVGPEDLAPLFPMELILQEVSEEAEVAIPQEILDIYSLWRPTPLYRARRLEQAVGTRSRIFYKYEGVSPAGSHKPNTAVAQAHYNVKEGRTRLSTETGAGQWGSALAFACKLFGLECKVYMVKISYEQKPFRRSLIQTWGATIVASPSEETQSGRAILEEHPDSPGSLGIAISEAVEDAAGRDDTAYSLGSVLNHVLLHQTVIGQEAIAQMELAGAFPDVVIGCVGGGSNFAGLAFPFLREKIAGRDIDVLACEPSACPTLTRGLFAYDFGDTSKLTPLVPMHTLGHDFIPEPIHAGGLRYHGVAPLISQLVLDGLDPRGGVPPERHLRVGRPVRGQRGDHPGAGGRARDPRRDHDGPGRGRGRRGADDPLQPLRPRPFRHGRLRQLLRRQARGRRPGRGRDAARAAGDRGAPHSRLSSKAETRELRLAVVLYGGASLAIYMHGTTKELHRLVKASALADAATSGTTPSERVYGELLAGDRRARPEGVRTRVVVDVIAGTSAGGMNGVYLSKALAHNRSQDALRDLWLDRGDIKVLLRGPELAAAFAEGADAARRRS